MAMFFCNCDRPIGAEVKGRTVSIQKPHKAIAAQRIFKPKSTSRPPPSSVAIVQV
jgi:hypothetical protein